MFNRNHNFSFLDSYEFIELVEFEPVLLLLSNIESLKNGTAVISESESNILTESVLSKVSTY